MADTNSYSPDKFCCDLWDHTKFIRTIAVLLQQLYGEIVQLQSALNDDYNNVQEKSNMYDISEPIIIRLVFSKTCATLFTFEQFSLIHLALQ